MTTEEIFDLWEQDGKIDLSQLSVEQANSPLLHNKYLKMFYIAKVTLKQLRAEHEKLSHNRAEWFMGKMSPEKMKELGWEPNALKIWDKDLSRYLKSDQLLIDSSLRIGLQEEKVSVLESIVNDINGRTFKISNCIKALKWENGEQ